MPVLDNKTSYVIIISHYHATVIVILAFIAFLITLLSLLFLYQCRVHFVFQKDLVAIVLVYESTFINTNLMLTVFSNKLLINPSTTDKGYGWQIFFRTSFYIMCP